MGGPGTDELWGGPGLDSCTIGALITDGNGNACGDFFAGTYTIAEQTQFNWMPTTPATQTVTISAGQSANANFGNMQQGWGELCISKFEDLNGNGTQDPGEPRLPNWSFTVTDSSGTSTVLDYAPP